MAMTEDRVVDDETAAALARCRAAWVSFSAALVLSMQREAWTPEAMLAAVARYRDLEPLIVALNGDGGLQVTDRAIACLTHVGNRGGRVARAVPDVAGC